MEGPETETAESAEQEARPKVMEALETVVNKLKEYIMTQYLLQGASGEIIEKVVKATDRPVTLYIIAIKSAFETHSKALAARNIPYFQNLLDTNPLIPKFTITPEIAAKGFLYEEVFRGLFADLENECTD